MALEHFDEIVSIKLDTKQKNVYELTDGSDQFFPSTSSINISTPRMMEQSRKEFTLLKSIEKAQKSLENQTKPLRLKIKRNHSNCKRKFSQQKKHVEKEGDSRKKK